MPGRLKVAVAQHKFEASNTKRRYQFIVIGGVVQIAFIILFGFFVRYGKHADARYYGNEANIAKAFKTNTIETRNPVENIYGMFQDIHVMMFVGFGFLMTFLKRYGFNSVGINFFLASLIIQWSIIVHGFFHLKDNTIYIEMDSLLTADFSCVGVLITYGCLLGKLTPVEMLVLGMIETPIFIGNEYLGLEIFQTKDVGGSIFLHIYGAYFGLFCSLALFKKSMVHHHSDSTIYHSEIFGMIGTLFLWMFWPSFNSAILSGDDRHRAIINTYIALAACCVTAFVLSALVTEERKLLMMHIQNSTIAGGVAVGTVADMMIQPWGAVLIGMISAIISVFGYRFLTPALERIKFHDTAGVHNLHGMPGLMSGICSIICCLFASEETYGKSLYHVFPAMAPKNMTQIQLLDGIHEIKHPQGRTAQQQALYQLAAIGATLACASVGGILTGLFLRLPCFDSYDSETYYSDEPHWHRPEDGFPDRFTQMIYHGKELTPQELAVVDRIRNLSGSNSPNIGKDKVKIYGAEKNSNNRPSSATSGDNNRLQLQGKTNEDFAMDRF